MLDVERKTVPVFCPWCQVISGIAKTDVVRSDNVSRAFRPFYTSSSDVLWKKKLSNFRTKLPRSSNHPRSGILPDVEHVCVMGRIAAVVGDGVWISSEPDSNPLPPPDSESGKEKSE